MRMCLNEYGQCKGLECGCVSCMHVVVTEGHSRGGNWGEKPCIYLSSQFLGTKILLSLSALTAVEEVGLQHCAMSTLCGCVGCMTPVWHNSSSPHWSQENDRMLSKYFTVLIQDHHKSCSVWWFKSELSLKLVLFFFFAFQIDWCF